MTDPREQDQHDANLARLLGESRASSFGVYFADRVMERVRADERPARRLSRPSWAGILGALPSLRLATSLAAVAVLVIMSLNLVRPHAVSAPAGAPVSVALSDGSTVTLAPGSALRWSPFVLHSTRSVELEGEAFFEVAHAPKAFVVSTFDATVTVTGTRFNVRSWRSQSPTEVALVEGSVLLDTRPATDREAMAPASLASAGPLALAAGDIARIGTGGIPSLVDPGHTPEQAASWRSGGFAFRDRPLSDLVEDLERRFATHIEADPQLLAERSVTYMNPGKPRLEEVLDAVSFALGLRYTRTAQGWLVVNADSTQIP